MPFFWRDVAQLGSALRSGRRGRWFESSHPDSVETQDIALDTFYADTFNPPLAGMVVETPPPRPLANKAFQIQIWHISEKASFVAYQKTKSTDILVSEVKTLQGF